MDYRFWVGLLLVSLASAQNDTEEEPSIYKTCQQLDYCNRLRDKAGSVNFEVVTNSIIIQDDLVSFLLLNKETNRYVDFNVSVYENHVVRLLFQEQDFDRYYVQNVFTEDQVSRDFQTLVHEDRAEITGFDYSVEVNFEQFQVDIYKDDLWILSLNHGSRLTMETVVFSEEHAFAFDVFFPQALRTYGIPEHAEQLSLQSTIEGDSPYRLWNSDVPGYEVGSKLGLYGSIPLLYAHSVAHTCGVFLPNSAEQWVDINNSEESGVSAYFIVESGAFDLHVLLGPTPEQVAVQYTSLTGTAPLPQLWALGYQQSRWNYLDQEDVLNVIEQFDISEIPVDVIWGDIDTLDDYRYFTWNPNTFNDSVGMLDTLNSTHRKFVTHAGSAIKVDSGYSVYTEGLEGGYFVQNEDGENLHGQCWAGESVWVDFLNEEASGWYSGLFAFSSFEGQTATLGGFWNDMNEPSVFNDEDEKTLPRDALHVGGVSHRDVHNVYGFSQVRATYEGLMNRDGRDVRPFVLSRSFFAGSQRYTAVWTGDNVADWEHLHASYSMCLSISLSGISMCGADVGGFIGNPDTELLIRWYQAGAWLPFFRSHSDNSTERREPYLFEEDVVNNIRSAIQRRYIHLPQFYTRFYEHFRYGYPVIRPVFYEYPEDQFVVDIDDQLFLGDDIMVKQVAESNVSTVPVYFPGGRDTLWYDIESTLLYRGVQWLNVPVTLETIPAFYKGGSIIFKKNRARRNTYEMETDPFTVYIFLDDFGEAYGTIYTDDYHSFAYARREYNYFSLFYENDSLFMRPVDSDMPETHPDLVIDAYYIYRPPQSRSAGDEPVHVEPTIITKTADGTNVRDIRFNSKGTTIKLL